MLLLVRFAKELISAGDKVSAKRVIGLATFALYVYGFTYVLHCKVELPNQEIIKGCFEGCYIIIGLAFFGTAAEKIMAMRKGSQPPVNEPPPAT